MEEGGECDSAVREGEGSVPAPYPRHRGNRSTNNNQETLPGNANYLPWARSTFFPISRVFGAALYWGGQDPGRISKNGETHLDINFRSLIDSRLNYTVLESHWMLAQ